MWLIVSSCVTALTFLLVVRVSGRFRGDILTQFLLFAIWSRYVLAAFHEITFKPLAAGLSINAVAAICVSAIGITCIPLNLFRARELSLLYILMGLTVVSGVLNQQISGVIFVSIKWFYFLTIFCLTYRAIERYGREVVFRAIFACLSTPLLLQVMSVAIGHKKLSESDGSASYVGGYFHEAVFSVVLFTAMWLASMIRWRKQFVGPALVLGSAMGIALANYRTTILAATPTIATYFFAPRSDGDMSRRMIAVPLILTAAFLVIESGEAIIQRFNDILVVLSEPGDLLKPPAYYTNLEQDLFSGRVYIWAHYFQGYFDGSAAQWIIGFGPEAYQKTMPNNAHNTFVSYLYEYGIIGVLVVFTWYIQNLLRALRSSGPLFARSGAAGHVSFILLNLATLPLWQVEGLILYAILLATSTKIREEYGPAHPGYRKVIY